MKKNRRCFAFFKVKLKFLRRMKLTLMLTLAIVIQSFAGVKSQTKLNLNFKNSKISEVFQEIKNQSGIVVFYNSEDLDPLQKISIDLKDVSIEQALELILKDQSLNYKVMEEYIAIYKKRNIPTRKIQQFKVKTIKGKVVDCNNLPLPGVSVVIKGTTKGVSTNVKGEFIIKTEDKKGLILVFSFVGMKQQEVRITQNEYYTIKMCDDSESLSEVVVTGIQTIEKGRATGSFEVVNEKELKTIHSLDFREKIKNIAPGVYVGNENNIIIRGVGTLSHNSTPLYVVDGVPIQYDHTTKQNFSINPDDIASISILKDAASASIWGIKSSNGVIVITTKRGKNNNKFNVSFSSDYRWESKLKLADKNLLDINEYYNYKTQRLENKNFSEIDTYDALENIYRLKSLGQLNDNEFNSELERLKSYNGRQDEIDYLYRTAYVAKNNISIKYGNKNFSNYTSINYTDNKQREVGNEDFKVNFTSNSDFNISDNLKLTLGIKLNYGVEKQNAENYNLKPYQRIYDDNGVYTSIIGYNENAPQYYIDDLVENHGFLDWSYNPLKNQKLNDKKTIRNDYTFTVGVNYSLKGFKFSSLFSYMNGVYTNEEYYNPDHYKTRDLINSFTEIEGNIPDPNNPGEQIQSRKIIKYHLPNEGGIFYGKTNRAKSFTLRNTIEYTTQLNDFYFKAFIGNELFSYRNFKRSNELYGYNPDTFAFKYIDYATLSLGVETYKKGFDWGNSYLKFNDNHPINETIEKNASFFGTFSVDYKQKYHVFASARLDKTNILVNSKDFRNNPTWSVGSKWDIKSEEFFNLDFVNNLSVKVSYGVSGMFSKNSAPEMVGYYTNLFSLNNQKALNVLTPENRLLGWEKTKTTNLALNYRVFNKFSGVIELYNKKSYDVLSKVAIDPTSGWESQNLNSAEITNRGIDLSFNYNARLGNFEINSGLNFSYNYNNVDKINYSYLPSQVADRMGFAEGMPTDPVLAYNHKINKEGKIVIIDAQGKEFDNVNEIYNFSIDQYEKLGRLTPPIFGGLSNSISYKGFTLGMFFTYKFGHKFRMPIGNPYTPDYANKWASEKYQWQEPEDAGKKIYPKFDPNTFGGDLNHLKNSKLLVENADIIRLETLSLEYNLKTLLKNYVSNASIRFSAQNLWFWAKNTEGLDPDRFSSGIMQLPRAKQYIATLNFSF